jgi:hypothetical protein
MNGPVQIMPEPVVFLYLLLVAITAWSIWRPRTPLLVGATLGWVLINLVAPLIMGNYVWLTALNPFTWVVLLGWPLVVLFSLVACLFWPKPWRFIVPPLAPCGLVIACVRFWYALVDSGPIGGPWR